MGTGGSRAARCARRHSQMCHLRRRVLPGDSDTAWTASTACRGGWCWGFDQGPCCRRRPPPRGLSRGSAAVPQSWLARPRGSSARPAARPPSARSAPRRCHAGPRAAPAPSSSAGRACTAPAAPEAPPRPREQHPRWPRRGTQAPRGGARKCFFSLLRGANHTNFYKNLIKI